MSLSGVWPLPRLLFTKTIEPVRCCCCVSGQGERQTSAHDQQPVLYTRIYQLPLFRYQARIHPSCQCVWNAASSFELRSNFPGMAASLNG